MITLETRDDLIGLLKKDSIFAEIGVFKGDFSKIIFDIVNPNKLYLVDIFKGNMGSGDKDGKNMEFVILDDEYNKLVDYFKDNENVFVIKNDSETFINSLPNDYLDVIYIDADHSYQSVKSDLKSSFDKVKNNGFICGHDYNFEQFPGVCKAVDEFCDEQNLKITYITKDGCPSYCIKKIL
jgi:hypothetical protein